MDTQRVSAFIVIDFDNFFTKDLSTIRAEEIEFQVSNVLLDVEREFPLINYISIRLYGGWLRNGILTTRASTLLQLLSQVRLFPIVRSERIIHGDLELAKSLISVPDTDFPNTYVEKLGLPHLRIDHDFLTHTCEHNKGFCPPLILQRFTRTKNTNCQVQGCQLRNSDVFKAINQKMVDTMIACDILSLTLDEHIVNLEVDLVFLLSDDLDHVPSVVCASRGKDPDTAIFVGVKKRNCYEELTLLFADRPIQLRLYEH